MSQLEMKTKLFVLASVFTAGFLIQGIASLLTIASVKVNGPHYQDIITNKDLLADVLPPPNYIVESYLNVLLMTKAKSKDEAEQFIQNYEANKAEYFQRQEHWKSKLTEGKLKQEINSVSREPAESFFGIVDNEIIPAIRQSQKDVASEIVDSKLTTLFKAHRDSIIRIVDVTSKNSSETESIVAAIISTRLKSIFALGLILMVTICAFTLWMRQSAIQFSSRESENRSIIDAIGKFQSIVEYDLGGTVQSANDHFLGLLGYEQKEVQGQHHSMFLDKQDLANSKYRNFWNLLSLGECQSGEFKFKRKNGEDAWVLASYSPILNQYGKTIRIVSYATDITEHVKQRDAQKPFISRFDVNQLLCHN